LTQLPPFSPSPFKKICCEVPFSPIWTSAEKSFVLALLPPNAHPLSLVAAGLFSILRIPFPVSPPPLTKASLDQRSLGLQLLRCQSTCESRFSFPFLLNPFSPVIRAGPPHGPRANDFDSRKKFTLISREVGRLRFDFSLTSSPFLRGTWFFCRNPFLGIPSNWPRRPIFLSLIPAESLLLLSPFARVVPRLILSFEFSSAPFICPSFSRTVLFDRRRTRVLSSF